LELDLPVFPSTRGKFSPSLAVLVIWIWNLFRVSDFEFRICIRRCSKIKALNWAPFRAIPFSLIFSFWRPFSLFLRPPAARLDSPVYPQVPSRKQTAVRMSVAPLTRPSLLLRLRDMDDAEAWSDFVRLYTPLVSGHCLRCGLQEADAADVAQEVMRIAAQAMPEFQYDSQRGKFRGWLLQTTRFRLHKFFRRQRRAPQPASETAMQGFLNQEAGADDEARWEAEYRRRLCQDVGPAVRGPRQPGRVGQPVGSEAVQLEEGQGGI
jgi:RNA polymerase sigma factor (sigma-70 family)